MSPPLSGPFFALVKSDIKPPALSWVMLCKAKPKREKGKK